jgi:chromosome segregation ATPase
MDNKNDFNSKHDRPSLHSVRVRYDGMKEMIGELSSKLTNVSSHIEKEFLAAYRVHMLSVQAELKDLKDQVVQAEEALNDDQEVSQLESEVTWFSDETTRLRNQSKSMSKDMNHVVNRIDALREQKKFLNEQLKATLKRTRILEAEIDIFTAQYESDEASGSGGFRLSALQNEIDGQYSSSSAASKKGTSKMSRSQSLKNVAQSTSALPVISKPKKTMKRSISDTLLPKPKNADVGEHTKVLASEELRQLEDSRLAVDLDLESAIKSVFVDIIDRKVKSLERNSPKKQQPNATWKIDPALGGLTGLGLSHFSDNDRLSAIATFIGSKDNFRYITETLAFGMVVD